MGSGVSLIQDEFTDEDFSTVKSEFEKLTNEDSEDRPLFVKGGKGYQVIQLLVSSYELLSEQEVKFLLRNVIDEEEFRVIKENLTILFPLREVEGGNNDKYPSECRSMSLKFVPYHQNIVKWLVNKRENREYYVDFKLANDFMVLCMLSLIPGLSKSGEDATQWQRLELFHLTNCPYLLKYAMDHFNAAHKPYLSFRLLFEYNWYVVMSNTTPLPQLILNIKAYLLDKSWLIKTEARRQLKIFHRMLCLICPSVLKYGTFTSRQLCDQIISRMHQFSEEDEKRYLIYIYNAATMCVYKSTGKYTVSTSNLIPPEYYLEETLCGHKGKVYVCIVLNNGKQLATAGEDATIRIWNVDSGMCEQVITGLLMCMCICVCVDVSLY